MYKKKYYKYKEKYLSLKNQIGRGNEKNDDDNEEKNYVESEVPKKIHALWLNFKEKKDGVLPKSLEVYVNRLKKLHESWEIKIWTSWSEIEKELSQRHWMLEYMRNPYCNPANKSDCLRFHILEKYGGVWVDLSTYFIKSLDELYYNNKTAFTAIYMHPLDAHKQLLQQFICIH